MTAKTAQQHADAFIDFHHKNRHILALYVRFARELRAVGHERASIALITERIRWEHAVEVHHTDEFKINNNFRAHYARILNGMEEFKGMFATRAAKVPA
jgi:hypothetical protein